MKNSSAQCPSERYGQFVAWLAAAWLTLCTAHLSAQPVAGKCLIGPFYTNDPEGLVMIPNRLARKPVAYSVGVGWVDHGHYMQSYRGITRVQWHLQAMRWGQRSGISRMYWLVGRRNAIHIHWQRVTGTATAVASLTVERPLQVVLECSPTWHGYRAEYSVKGNEIIGSTPSATSRSGFTLLAGRPADGTVVASNAKAFIQAMNHGGSAPASMKMRYAGLLFNLKPQHPLTFVVRLGLGRMNSATTLTSVPHILRHGWNAYIKDRPYASGDWGDFVAPITAAANEGIVYLPQLRNLSGTVVRSWCVPGGCVLFEWDSFFNAMLLSVDDHAASPWLVRRQLAGIFHFQLKNGLVCNFSNWGRVHSESDPNPGISLDRSEPPVGAMCVWQAYQRWPSRRLLETYYRPLARYHHWWFSINPSTHLPYRDGNRDGLLEWGSATKVWQNARYESGMDDTPMYVRGKALMMPTSDTFDVDDVGLNSLWAADAMYLAKIAAALGHRRAAAHYTDQWKSMAVRINALLWNHKLGMYCNRYWSRGKGHHLLSRRWSPTNFYPMIARVPDRQRADRMLAVMLNKKYFWGRWVIPSIAKNNPAYVHQEYWRGDIWGPTNYLTFQGLLHYAPTKVLHAFARKSVLLFMRNWKRTGIWSENYLSTTGIASHDRHYSWGALLPMIGLQAICNVNINNSVRLDGTWNLHAVLQNIPILGYRYTIMVKPGSTELLHHGHQVALAAGRVINIELPQRHAGH